jgi:hypothetical protein
MMKLRVSLLLLAIACLLMLIGCQPTVKEYAYYPSQFKSRVDWLRICQHYWLASPSMCREEGE